jgi:hypothetical protein
MTDVEIMKEMGDFERSHEGVYISYVYDDDEDIDAYWFKMTLNNYYVVEREVSGKQLCLLLFSNPLPYIFEEMYQKLRSYQDELSFLL